MMRISQDKYLVKVKEIEDDLLYYEEENPFFILAQKDVLPKRRGIIRKVFSPRETRDVGIEVELKPIKIIDEKYLIYKFYETRNKPYANYISFDFYGFSSEPLTHYLKEKFHIKFPAILEIKF